MKRLALIGIAVLIIGIGEWHALVLADSSGVKYPSIKTTQAVAPEDDVNWSNPAHIGASDNVYAKAVLTWNKYTYRLKAQDFVFSAIPDGSVIDGILVEIERFATVTSIKDYRVQLLNAFGVLVGDNKASAASYPTVSDGIASYGGATDKWNASPTTAMVKDADFGIVLSVLCSNYVGGTVYVDCIRITIYYTIPPPEPAVLVLLPEFDTNYVGSNHSLVATVWDDESELMAGIDVIWSIEDGPGWFVAYNSSTNEDGEVGAVVSSNVSGNTTIKCAVDGYPGVFDTAVKQWDELPAEPEPAVLVLEPEFAINYVGSNHSLVATVWDDESELMPGVDVIWSIEDGPGWFVAYNSTTNEDGEVGAVVSSNVSGNTTIKCVVDGYPGVFGLAGKGWLSNMPLWYILGLAALAVGAWFSQSIVVNIMLMIMCAGGFELTDACLTFSQPLYYSIRGVLILGIVFALLQLFTRVKHI